MKERPIIFSAPMVRAILSGTKTQARRIVKPQPDLVVDGKPCIKSMDDMRYGRLAKVLPCPFGATGDKLWGRESGWERPERTPHMMREGADTWARYYYDADDFTEIEREQFKKWGFIRRPSIHMPRWASRLTLEVVSARVERVQDISEADAIAEGIVYSKAWDGFGDIDGRYFHCTDSRRSYEHLWDHIHGPASWDANPWVWVIEFRRIA